MKTLKRCFPIRSFITLAENFDKWRPYLELFWGATGGAEISLGAAAPSPLGTAPGLRFVFHSAPTIVRRRIAVEVES